METEAELVVCAYIEMKWGMGDKFMKDEDKTKKIKEMRLMSI